MINTKKITCFLLACVLLWSSIPVIGARALETGDIDGENRVNAQDALYVLRYSVKSKDMTEEQKLAADVNDDGTIDAKDALMILQYSVRKIDMFPADMTEEQKYYAGRDAYYGASDENFIERDPVDLNNVQEIVEEYGVEPEPSGVDSYSLTDDGLLAYTRISKEAAEMGRLHKYDNYAKTTGTMELGDTVLHYSLPTDVTAYDAVPISYSVTTKEGTPLPLHFEATTFEETDRYPDADSNYFDCELPGKISVELTYDGYGNR